MQTDMSTGAGGCKKRRRGGEKVFKFRAFCEPGYPSNFGGPFHQNIRALLECGHMEDTSLCGDMQSWSFQLEIHRHPTVMVSLFVIEEPIEMSIHRLCDQCRYAGWGHHMICNRRYHFVLPSKETELHSSCKGSEAAAATMLQWVELEAHLLHGVIHSNGFGHLLSLNGMEAGSDFLTGHHIMDFWDRICTALRARKVSLIDVAKKRSMDLRLVHAVAYGEPWFGRWSYIFGRGSYGVTQQMHQKAIQALQDMPLCLLVRQLATSNPAIPIIWSRYQAVSGHSLTTMGQLLYFMLELRLRLAIESPSPLLTTPNQGPANGTACRWSSKRVDKAVWVIVEFLKKAEFRWVSRQEVRDAARVYIGDTGLLDFVLKSLGNHIVGNYVIRRALNPVTKVLEYCLEDISSPFPNHAGLWPSEPKTMAHFHVTRAQLTKDTVYLYKNILKQQTTTTGVFASISSAVRIILDTKHLIKDYSGNIQVIADQETLMKLSCTVCSGNVEETEEMSKARRPPHELVILPAHVTIEELKREVERSFREMYWCLRDFVAESIVIEANIAAKDSDSVYGLIESGSSVVVRGRSVGWSVGMCERGEVEWVVDCPCGAKEDDGEGLIPCDICEVRQHKRCVGVSDDGVPQVFLCRECEQNITVFPSL